MKKLLIVANWKSNKTESQAKEWLADLSFIISHLSIENKEIIICAPFTLLSEIKKTIQEHQLSIKLAAQDISRFEPGAYTGEVNGAQIKEFAEYVLVGHSERRKNFDESDQELAQKVKRARDAGLEVIYCVQGKETEIPHGIQIVAYEPTFAIGTGNPDTPENANMVALEIKKKNPSVRYVLYGGSIKPENVNSFTGMPDIDGVLVGGGSLDAKEFAYIIENA